MSGQAARLDAFTDAAFAFALTLFVAGESGAFQNIDSLRASVSAIPAFAIGFAIIAMFWHSHVRWRGIRGQGDWRSILLTLALVFVVLVFVHPLRAMATSFAAFLTGSKVGASIPLGEIFGIYGIGFIAMSMLTLGLFVDALRNRNLTALQQFELRGEIVIWALLGVTGLVSVVLAQSPRTEVFAPAVYASLPVTIGLFSAWWFHRWEPPAAE